MNKFLLLPVATVAVLLTSACQTDNAVAPPTTPDTITAPNQTTTVEEEIVVEPSPMADFVKEYRTFGDLVADAEVVIEGTVLATEAFEFKPEGTDFVEKRSKLSVQVIRSFKEDVQAGDVLTFVEHDATRDPNALKTDQNVLLFARMQTLEPKSFAGTYYYILNTYQGKFIINDDKIERLVFDPPIRYAPLKMTRNEAEAKIQALVTNPAK